MAKGKKTGGNDFKPGWKGGPGRPPIPLDLKQSRAAHREEFDRALSRMVKLSGPEIVEMVKSPTAPILETIAARVLSKAFNEGDHKRLEFILDRLIGKVSMEAPAAISSPFEESEKVSFTQFCINAMYPPPFAKQLEMLDFGMNEVEPRILLGARGYGKSDYVTVLGVAYDIYLNGIATTNLIITQSRVRNAAIIAEIAGALAANGIELEQANSKSVRVKGLIGTNHSVEAITLGSSFRGRHPKRVLMDDPVTEEDVSPAKRKLVKRKYNEAYKLCKNIVIIGQPAHADDLYAELRPKLLKMEVPHGQIPQLDADLEAMAKAGVDPVSIEMSYHLRVPVEGSMPFAGIRFIDKYPVGGDSIAFIDPSDGGDYTAVTVMRGLMDGVAVQGKVWKRAWYHCVDDLAILFKLLKVQRVCFETNMTGTQPVGQLQQAFAPLGIGVVGKRSDSNKHAVIMAAGSYSNLIHLSQESDPTYTSQVVKYEYGVDFDDAPDSLARCLEWVGYIKGKSSRGK